MSPADQTVTSIRLKRLAHFLGLSAVIGKQLGWRHNKHLKARFTKKTWQTVSLSHQMADIKLLLETWLRYNRNEEKTLKRNPACKWRLSFFPTIDLADFDSGKCPTCGSDYGTPSDLSEVVVNVFSEVRRGLINILLSFQPAFYFKWVDFQSIIWSRNIWPRF